MKLETLNKLKELVEITIENIWSETESLYVKDLTKTYLLPKEEQEDAQSRLEEEFDSDEHLWAKDYADEVISFSELLSELEQEIKLFKPLLSREEILKIIWED